MAHEDLLEPFERMLTETFSPDAIRAIEAGSDWQASWDVLEASGFLDALVPEQQGGFGLGWDAAGALFQALGRRACPLPVGEAMVLRGLLAEAGEDRPQRPLKPQAQIGSLVDHIYSDMPGLTIDTDSEKLRPAMALLYAAQIAGAAGHLLDTTVAYANERVQFGRPIGRQQAVQQQLAVMAEEVVATRLAVELACASGDTPDLLRAASAKALASRYAASIAATAHAVHGAIGISAEYDLQLYTRRLQSWRLARGAETYWDAELGQAVLTADGTVLDWVRSKLHG